MRARSEVLTVGFNSTISPRENDLSCNPLKFDRGMEQLIDHTVKEWLRVDEFLKLYADSERRAALCQAAETVQTAVHGLLSLINYDGRLPKISGLIAFARWVENLYAPGNKPYIAMNCCAEQLARHFTMNTGDPHWQDVAKIVLETFHGEPPAAYKTNPGRWIRKQIKAFHRLWDKGDSKPGHLPIVERSRFLFWDDSYYAKQNSRREDQHRLQSKIWKLREREARLLTKIIDKGDPTKRRKAIEAARIKSPKLRAIDEEISAAQMELTAARKRWADEDQAERRKSSARSAYHWRRAST